MKATHDWLASYVATGRSAREVADLLTMSGTECEGFSELAKGDACMVFEITSNRVDCLGMLGLARELSSLTGEAVEVPQAEVKQDAKSTKVSVEITSDALEKCPHYTARVIRGVKVGPSPDWLRKRLENIGVASINNVVDITNYVLFEYSQPLHAFDLGELDEEKIIVRRASKGEKFEAINHREYELGSDDLVIADANRAVAIAGVMGGVNSEVGDSTTDVLLESAFFHTASVKATGRKLDKQHSDNLESDARYRFERGVDPASVIAASDRAVAMILEIAGGSVEGPLIEAGKPGEAWLRELTLHARTVERVLGEPVKLKRCSELLAPLGLEILDVDAGELRVKVPSYRRDLEREIDLVEEIARLHGLENFAPRLTLPIAPSRKEPIEEDQERVHRLLLGMGFDEIVSDAFVPAGGSWALTPWDSAAPLHARNPVNSACPALRRSLMPSVLKALAHNEHQSNQGVKLFEMAGVTLTEAGGDWREPITVALAGPDFAAAKGAVDELCKRLGVDGLEISACDYALFEKGRGAELRYEGKLIGVLGEISSKVAKEFDLRGRVGVGELDVNALLELKLATVRFAPLPRFPVVDRDLALVVDEDVRWADVQAICHEAASHLLRDVSFFDEFRGKQVAKGKKSIAFSLRFRDDERTLTGEEVEAEMQNVIKALQAKTGGELRA